MVPLFLSVATRWYTNATSRGTAHLAIPALLVVASMLVGGWELLRRAPLGSPRSGATALAPSDTTVVFGPQRFDAPIAALGDSEPTVNRFPTEVTINLVPLHRYVVRVTNGDPDGTARVSSGSIDGRRITAETGVLTFEIAARAVTVLDIAIDAQPAPGSLTLEVLDVSGGSVLVFGMERFTRGSGRAVSFIRTFTVDDQAGAPFHLWVVNGNADGTARLADVSVHLNGALTSAPLASSTATTMTTVTPMMGLNELQIVLPEQGPGFVQIGVTGTDVAAPILTIAAPAPGLITRDTTVTVSGTVTDGSPVAVTVNGRIATRTGTGYSVAVPLSEGQNTLAISAVDAVGARADSSRVVVGDRTAPTLTVTTPNNSFVTGHASITVSGSVTDAGAVTVNANGVPLPVKAGAFTGAVALGEGANVLSITAADAAGNATTVVRTGTRASGSVAIDGVIASLKDDDVLASDAFTRANETPLGGDWTATGLNLASNQVVPASLGTDGIAYYSDIAWPDNQFSRAALSVTGTAGAGQGAGLVVRRSATANTHYRLIVDHDGDDNVSLERRIAGTDVNLATFTQSWSNGDVWELRATGMTLKIFLNDVQVGTTVLDSLIESGNAGIAYAATETAAAIDDWEGGSPAAWAHEPAGFVAIKTTDFTALPIDGWDVTEGPTIVTDETAPVSQTDKVVQFEYDTELPAGEAPGTLYDLDFPDQVGTYFLGYNVKFSDPFDLPGNGVTMWSPLHSAASTALGIRSDSTVWGWVFAPEPQGGVQNLAPNVAEVKVTLGDWVKIEHYFKPASSPTAEDGIFRWWVDGELSGNYTNLMWPAPDHTFESLQFWPGWGGDFEDTPDFTSYMWIDHVYLSRPRGGLPPDPVTVAPPISQSASTSLAASTEFLYTGDHPIQTGVDSGTIEPLRVAVLRGRVLDRDDAPLPGVTIRIKDHAELGQTLSRTDGRFDMAVNGGGVLTLDYALTDYLPAQRQVAAPWQDYAIVDDVILVQLDSAVTTIDFSDLIEVAQGSVVSDTDGTRQATAFFSQGTTAEMVLPGGGIDTLSSLDVRLTEYTVGANGPRAMPALLPSTSAYTYAVELSADEAIAAGATTVRFSQPVVAYLENFLAFPVGSIVPIGSYDRGRGVWVPESNGLVIKVLSISGDTANLDIDGDAAADDSSELATVGITDAEREKLADLYSANQSLWRMPLSHFTPIDANYPPDWSDDPNDPWKDGAGDQRPVAEQVDNPCEEAGSVIECQNQVLGETVGLVGTPFTLHYRSNRVPGFAAAMALDIRVTRLRIPAALIGAEVRVNIAGRDTTAVFSNAQFQTFRYRWDGRDAYGRLISGRQLGTYEISYVYPQSYAERRPGLGSFGFGQYCSRVVDDAIVPCDSGGTVSPQRFARSTVRRSLWLGPLAAWNALGQGVGGWSLDVHHAYDPFSRLLYLGSGERVEARGLRSPRVVAGSGSLVAEGNDSLATAAGFVNLADIVAAPDGGFYVADRDDHTVRHVRPDGVIEAFAGVSGSQDFSGDGGAATAAELDTPIGLALGTDGSVYIADAGNFRIRRVAPSGIIETFAGTGSSTFSGDNGPADSAGLTGPVAVTTAPDGSVYIADQGDTVRVRKVSTDGRIVTVAGAGPDAEACQADSIPAAATCFPNITDLAWGPDGALYVLVGASLHRIDPDGSTKRVAGDSGANCGTAPGDGGPARDAGLCATSVAVSLTGEVFLADREERLRVIEPGGIIRRMGSGRCANDEPDIETRGPTRIDLASTVVILPTSAQSSSACLIAVALAPDGSVLVAAPDSSRVHRWQAALPGLSLTTFVVAASDGGEVYVFDADGRHLATRDALTSATILTFAYDSTGRLVTVVDADSNVTTVERNGAGEPTAIVGPFGQETALGVDSLGYLTTVTNPAGEVIQLSHSPGGLLEHIVNPLGDTTAFTYDADGLLTREDDPAGGFRELERATLGTDSTSMDSTVVTLTTAEERVTRYDVGHLGAEEGRRTVSPAGLATTSTMVPNGGKGIVRTRTETPDGMLTSVTTRRDPRFPAAAVLDSMQVKTPGDLISEVLARRTVVLSDPDDPLSLVSQTDSVTVNDNTTVSVYTASTRRQVTTTPEGRESVTRFDSVGRVVATRAANLDSTVFSYDSLGRLEEQLQGGRLETYAYDPGRGRLASITDALGRVTQFEYDSAGRVTSQIRPDYSEILFAYDSAGNVTSLTPPGRPAHGFQYNAVGLVTQYDPPTIAAGAKPTKYFYNLDRQLDSLVRPDSVAVSLGYDAAGRPNAVTFDRGTLSLGYSNTTGNLNRIRTPESDSLLFSYDGSVPTQVRWSGTVEGTVGIVYDNDFRVAGQTVNGTDTVYFNYDADGLLLGAGGLLLGRSTTNGLLLADTLGRVRSAYQYSSRGDLQGYRVKHDTLTLFATGYVRDSLAQIVQLFDTAQGTPKRWSFVYDSVGRLVKDSVNGAVFHVFTYDSNGNRLSYTSGAGTVNYSYDNQDRLLWSRVGTDTTKYTYNSNGELKTKTVPGVGTTTYTYDALGNLISVVLPNSTAIQYVVDGQNRRVGRKIDGDLVQSWLYQNQLNPIAELDSAGTVVTRFVYGSRANVPDFLIRGDSVFRLIADHLGSVRLVVDTATGTVAQRLDYDEWGNVTQNTNPGFQPFGFAGGLFDAATGLTRFGVRDYDANAGRWNAKDPVGILAGDPNTFAYAADDPINLIDPAGAQAEALATGWAGALLEPTPVGEVVMTVVTVGVAVVALVETTVSIVEKLARPRAGRWVCTARCHGVTITNPCCPKFLDGWGTGPSQLIACNAAKRAATQSAPRGCQGRHCKCSCTKR